MNQVIKLFLIFILLCVFLYIIQEILFFLGISPSSYILYIAWFIALTVFYFILPSQLTFFK